MSKMLKIALIAAAAPLGFLLRADDGEAGELLKQANAEFKAEEFHAAAGTALDAELMADSPAVKAMAVSLAVQSNRKAEFYYREFENIEKLLNSYSNYADFNALVEREFDIGDMFFAGRRDPAYYALRWVPWLVDEDRTVEVYEKAIGHAPYSKRACSAKLRTAVRMLETTKDFEKPLALLRGVVRDYPDTPEAESARLHLAVALANLAKYGDGDGAYSREAVQVMNEYKLKYPDAPENAYVDTLIAETRSIQAKRLLDTAEFYRKHDRPEVSQRYLGEVVRLYSDTASADDAERQLTAMDRTYVPQPVQPAVTPTIPSYAAYPLPDAGGDLIVAPQDSEGKYLLPIRDLGLDQPSSEDKK